MTNPLRSKRLLHLALLAISPAATNLASAVAIDCWVERCLADPAPENFIGWRYKAALVQADLPRTKGMLLFNGCAFTSKSGAEPHTFDMMIKAGPTAMIYDDGLCGLAVSTYKEVRDEFGFEFGLSDYEDPQGRPDNDIGLWSRNARLFPRLFSNIDVANTRAPDKAEAEYQVTNGGALLGKVIEASLQRAEATRLSRQTNYYMDPDSGCRPNSQTDITYRHWIATFRVPALKLESTVDAYVNAAQADYICGNTINLMWENPSGPVYASGDHFKVIIFDIQVQTVAGQWRPVTHLLVDYRAPKAQFPFDSQGRLLAGFRKATYNGRPALEVSFGYGNTDYVKDGDLTKPETGSRTMGRITLGAN